MFFFCFFFSILLDKESGSSTNDNGLLSGSDLIAVIIICITLLFICIVAVYGCLTFTKLRAKNEETSTKVEMATAAATDMYKNDTLEQQQRTDSVRSQSSALNGTGLMSTNTNANLLNTSDLPPQPQVQANLVSIKAIKAMSTNQLGEEIDDILNDLDGPGALAGVGNISMDGAPGHAKHMHQNSDLHLEGDGGGTGGNNIAIVNNMNGMGDGMEDGMGPGTDALINAGIKDENYVSWTQKQVILWLKMHLVNNGINRKIVKEFLIEFSSKCITGQILQSLKENPQMIDDLRKDFTPNNQAFGLWAVVKIGIQGIGENYHQ